MDEPKTGLKPIEVAKVLFRTGEKLCTDYEEDEHLDIGEIKDAIFQTMSDLWDEYND